MQVRHDQRVAAPLVTAYAAPLLSQVVEAAPVVSKEVEEVPVLGALKSQVVVPSSYPSHIVSAPQVYATGPATIVAVSD